MNTLRQELHTYINELPESKLIVLRPLLSEMANDAIVIETDLTGEEIAKIDAGMARYEESPDSFMTLDDFKAAQ
jgi:hypothetical protein